MKNKITKIIIIGIILLTGYLGIKELTSPAAEKPTTAAIVDSTTNTTLLVVNNTTDTVNVWLTLGVYTDSLKNYYLQNVNGVFGILDSGAVGIFAVLPNDTLSYTSTLGLSGNLCFGGPAINCPNTQWPTATNIFEFCLNNNFGLNPQESVEISCIAGVNAFLAGRLIGDNWIVTQGIDTVRTFKNDIVGHNSGLYGVFPTGCTNCTNQQGAPTCTPAIAFDTPNNFPICIIQRPAIGSGGTVICIFNGFTPVICDKSN